MRVFHCPPFPLPPLVVQVLKNDMQWHIVDEELKQRRIMFDLKNKPEHLHHLILVQTGNLAEADKAYARFLLDITR